MVGGGGGGEEGEFDGVFSTFSLVPTISSWVWRMPRPQGPRATQNGDPGEAGSSSREVPRFGIFSW